MQGGNPLKKIKTFTQQNNLFMNFNGTEDIEFPPQAGVSPKVQYVQNRHLKVLIKGNTASANPRLSGGQKITLRTKQAIFQKDPQRANQGDNGSLASPFFGLGSHAHLNETGARHTGYFNNDSKIQII